MRPTCASSRGGLVTLALVAASCATTATGRKQLTLLPDDEVSSMGEQAFRDLKREQPIETDPETTGYVRCVADAVARGVENGPGSWEVVVFEDDSANAFALPGGKLGVHTGLLSVAKTPDQLAAVIGHEMAHVTQEHGNERLSQTFLAEGGLAAASMALGGQGPERDLALAALGAGAQLGVLMPFSRAQEAEADAVGLDYMARAGFDPRASVELWKNMHAAGGAAPPEFLSSHPADENRIAALQKRMPSVMDDYEDARARDRSPACVRPERLARR